MDTNKENYHGYNRKLQPFANEHRKNMTKAEACLWKYALRAAMRKGYGFRRQRPVLNYIADFMCIQLKLIIEVDGITHTWSKTLERDNIREQKLQEAGFQVIRFTDDEVLHSINRVIEAIDLKIEEIELNLPVPIKREKEVGGPPPCPRQRGIMGVALKISLQRKT